MATVSDFIIDRLLEWDLHHYYGFPGDGIGGFDGALGRAEKAGKKFTYIRPTHEEMAALMASAHAKFTGEVGVCIATSGPGAIHLMNGLYDAKCDNQPVLAIVGQQAQASMGTDFQQELNMERIFGDVAAFVKTVETPMQAQAVLDKAIRTAMARRQPCVVVLPTNVQTMEFEPPAAAHWVSRSGIGYASRKFTPTAEELQQAADVLNAGEKVAMLVGEGAIGATDQVLAVADKLGAGIVTALLGKEVVPGDIPYHTQQVGLLGSRPSYDMMQNCDTLLMVGTNFPYSEFLPPTGNARAVQIDIVPEHLGIRYPTEVNLWGDTRSTLTALLPMLTEHGRDWQNDIVKQMQEWENEVREVGMADADPINPRRVYISLNERLPENAIITADAGTTADWYGHHIRLGRHQMGNLSGRLATMLAAMPYAMAGKFAHPDRPVVCTIGDGAFQMLGMNGMITVKKHWKEWADPTFIVLILHNNDLTQVSWEMREVGDPRWDTAQLIESIDYAAYAELLGFEGITVTDPEQIDAAWDRAFAARRPVILDVHVDRDVPPLPAHISVPEALGVAKSVLHGDPERGRMIKEGMRAMKEEVESRLTGGKK
ncbi:MAG TPA: thiamine pyrophosphate-requiring protein [Propionibacteriaceae bacterium]|nr:thiamine pyrophosphate-requiring protein [Propionibacteriaceae bacterium]